MNDLKVHLMHVEVSATLERLSKLFKPGMKITFIARLPGNGEADVLIGDDHDADELIALVRRRFGMSTVSAPAEIRSAALKDAAKRCEEVAFDWDQAGETRKHDAAVYLANCILDMRTGSAVSAAEEVTEYELAGYFRKNGKHYDKLRGHPNEHTLASGWIAMYERTTSGKGEAA